MSVVSLPIDRLISKWSDYFPPSIANVISANHNVIIPTAVVGGAVVLIVYQLWPRSSPKELKNLPSVSFRKAIGTFLDQKTPFDEKYKISREELPLEARRLYKFPLGVFTVINIGSPEAAKQFFDQSNFAKAEFTPSVFGYPSFIAYYMGNNIASVNDPDWSRHRVVVKPAFSRPLRTPPFIESATHLIRTLHAIKDKSSVEIYPWMQRLTLDVLGRVIFSFDFLSLKDPEDPGMYVESWNKMMSRLFHPLFAIYPILCYIPTKWVTDTWTLIKDFRGLLIRMIDERREAMKAGVTKNEKDMDLLDLMLIACENDKGFSMDDVVSDLSVFFLAGHDTTANVLSLALYLMAKHKDVQEKARQEVHAILGKAESLEDAINNGPEHTQLGKLQYINAIMKETIRMYPSVTNIGIRRALKDVPIQFRDFNGVEREEVIPKGTKAAVDVFGMQHDPGYYDDPYAFKPERWLNTPDEEGGLKPWMPFGGGPRICLGMQFSIVEQKVTLAMILRNFELDLPVKNGVVEEMVLNSGGLLRPQKLGVELKSII